MEDGFEPKQEDSGKNLIYHVSNFKSALVELPRSSSSTSHLPPRSFPVPSRSKRRGRRAAGVTLRRGDVDGQNRVIAPASGEGAQIGTSFSGRSSAD